MVLHGMHLLHQHHYNIFNFLFVFVMDSISKLEDIEKKISCITDKIDDIHKALVGDSYDKEKGVIPRLKKIERYVEIDKKVKWIGGGFILALGGIIGGGIKHISDWFNTHI